MTTISDGDIIEIVMDAVHVSGPVEGREYERVLVQGVFPRVRDPFRDREIEIDADQPAWIGRP